MSLHKDIDRPNPEDRKYYVPFQAHLTWLTRKVQPGEVLIEEYLFSYDEDFEEDTNMMVFQIYEDYFEYVDFPTN